MILLLPVILIVSITVYASTLTLSPTAAITDEVGGFTELSGAFGIITVVNGTNTYALVAASSDDGVQIINITTPSSPTAVAAITDGSGGFTTLSSAADITTVVIGGRTYALVSAFSDNGVQIIDITTPSSPTAVAAITDGATFTELSGVRGITTVVIGANTYALVAAYTDDGVQIINITTPSSPTAVAAITDGSGGFTTLDGTVDITTVVIGANTYALVAAQFDDGVQIIDITTPSSPTAVAAITDGITYTELDGVEGITTVVIGANTYALVAANTDSGIQIINITTPSSPTAVAAITDGSGGFTTLLSAVNIATRVIGVNTYALVTSEGDEGVQLIDITTPSSPTAVAAITDGSGGFTTLFNARGITTVVIGANTYALVAATGSHGIQIIQLISPITHTKTLSDSMGITDRIQITKSGTSFTSTGTVSTGGELTATLPQNTAGSTNTVVVDMPSTVAATITVSTTTSGTSDSRILFVGQILDINITNPTSSSFTYQVRITFTDADLTAAGISRNNVVMYRDANENGSFETNESLTTTISSTTSPYTATADVPANSKFAIGGVVNTSANAVAGVSAAAAGHLQEKLSDHCDESGFGDGKSLRIYEISYDKCDANQITILADTTCGPLKVMVGKESSQSVAVMPLEQPYLNDEKRMILLSSSISSDDMEFSVIAKDKRDEFSEKIYANQCTGTTQYTYTTGYTSMQSNAGLLPEWIKNNARWWADDSIDDDTFVNGIQYLVKNNILSVQKTQTDITTENTDNEIPEWIKNNARWWADGSIDDDTFVNGIQYLVNNGIISVT